MEHVHTAVPDKLFYKAAEVCEITDTQPYVLRFWESEFPQLATEKNRSGQRVYRRQDVDLILRIKRLLYEEEYTIAGARKALEEDTGAAAPPALNKSRKKTAAAAPTEYSAPSESGPRASATLFHEPAEPVESVDERYRPLYQSALTQIDELKTDLAAAASSRDALRERARRLASRLEAALHS